LEPEQKKPRKDGMVAQKKQLGRSGPYTKKGNMAELQAGTILGIAFSLTYHFPTET
jgi:hypothetical protein